MMRCRNMDEMVHVRLLRRLLRLLMHYLVLRHHWPTPTARRRRRVTPRRRGAIGNRVWDRLLLLDRRSALLGVAAAVRARRRKRDGSRRPGTAGTPGVARSLLRGSLAATLGTIFGLWMSVTLGDRHVSVTAVDDWLTMVMKVPNMTRKSVELKYETDTREGC